MMNRGQQVLHMSPQRTISPVCQVSCLLLFFTSLFLTVLDALLKVCFFLPWDMDAYSQQCVFKGMLLSLIQIWLKRNLRSL